MTVVPDDPQDRESIFCTTGYRYSDMDTLKNSGSYMLIAGMENSSNDEGFYQQSTFIVPAISINTYDDLLVANAANLCSLVTTDCDANGTVYVIGK